MVSVRDGHSYEELLLGDEQPIRLDTEEDFKTYDRRSCSCAKPMVMRSAIPSAGVGVLLRLCCLAKKFEELTGSPANTFYQVFDFMPSFQWDCDAISRTERHMPGGMVEVTEYRLGPPPDWIRERMESKGVQIWNLRPGMERNEIVDRWTEIRTRSR